MNKQEDLISRQQAIDTAVTFVRRILLDSKPIDVKMSSDYIFVNLVEPMRKLPSAQPETHEERTETHACDCISRQAAMEEISKQQTYKMFEEEDTLYLDANDVGSVLASLPSEQPELPEWAQKVEEYRKSAPSYINNPLVWALYQVWKEYDVRLVHQRGKENR